MVLRYPPTVTRASYINFLIDVAHQRLVNADSYLSTPLQPAPFNLALHISLPTDAYSHLFTTYPKVFRPELRQTPTALAKHGIYHHIKTTAPPVFAKLRCLAPDQLAAAKQTFAEKEEMSVCLKASILVITLTYRPEERWFPPSMRDCRRLNMQTEPDEYPLTNITDVTSYLHKMKGFSTLDLLKGNTSVTCASCSTAQQNGLFVRHDKYNFGANEMSFLGHRITPEGVHPLSEKVAPI
ncbi:uncharacterized protein [Palaemon carinicauda]|uniref:uncharacterized protein n=1 Tax=Palaemon carinicauda TaxID=392227 RepID=UPI0035B5CB02